MTIDNELNIDGVCHTLQHLRPLLVTVLKKGKNGANLSVKVSFSRHTVSQSGTEANLNMRDENNKPRLFCSKRYEFSLKLPALVERMIQDNHMSWQSKDKNNTLHYAVIDVGQTQFHKTLNGVYFNIFFYLYPSKEVEIDVNLVVVSCYERDVVFSNLKKKQPMHYLLRQCLYNQKRMP